MSYHKIHCPRCGRTMYADELAFDFGEIINIALEKAKNRTFGKTEEWYDLTQLNLCLYLTLDDLQTEYGFEATSAGSYEGDFIFSTENLAAHIVKLAHSSNPNMSIDILASGTDMVEYERLTRVMAKSGDEDIMRRAEKIQELANRIMRNKYTEIVDVHVKVNMQKDDRGNLFANRLTVKFEDSEIKNITTFLCKGEEDRPCGKILYGHAGQFEETVIGLAGTARVGKTAYLAALLACILRKGNGIVRLGHDQNIITNIAYTDESYEIFKKDLLEPYTNCLKISKTPAIFDKKGNSETIPLFSLTFSINGKKHIFTFIDMPGEVFDDGEHGADLLSNNRQIIKEASAIWFCIAPAQIQGQTATAGGEQVNKDLGQAFSNLGRTMTSIDGEDKKIPTAVLITCSDMLGEEYNLFHKDFNPFAGKNNPMNSHYDDMRKAPWISESGVLYYSRMLWFIENTYKCLNCDVTRGLPASIVNVFGHFTPFAVAAYGKDINNPFAQHSPIPEPSMIEGPFLWTLAVLGIIPTCEEKLVQWTEKKGHGPFKKYIQHQEVKNVQLKKEDLPELLYSESVIGGPKA